jgi:hypothetical protein
VLGPNGYTFRIASALSINSVTHGCSLAFIIHHSVLRTFDIVELTGLGSPDEDEPGGKTDEEHENDKSDDCPEHVNQPFLKGLPDNGG